MFYDATVDLLRKIRSPEVSLALFILEKYVNGAFIQWNRIQHGKRALPGKGPGVDGKLMTTLFLDIHFYFVCYDKAQNLIHHLAVETCDPKLREIWKNNKVAFRPYRKARNHLEHIETRIVKKYTRDFGNMHGNTFTFGGAKFDVGEAGLKRLASVYKEVVGTFQTWPQPPAPNKKAGPGGPA